MEKSAGTRAEVVVPCADLGPTLEFFTHRLGYRVEAIFPADHPAVAVVSGHGTRLRLDARVGGDPGRIRLVADRPDAVAGGERCLTAPNGMLVEVADAEPPVVVPPLVAARTVSRAADACWVEGRAGMRYRDLIPDRLGGRFIASHIVIPDAGPVPDYVHFHRVRFQMIFCRRGWVRLVYEDQGDPFVLRQGDCVLQPPEIRHRVLESSAGLEVIEIGCPAEHETRVDHDLDLPTPAIQPERDFAGQRFVRHRASEATWQPVRPGWRGRDTGIGLATAGVAGARVLRPDGPDAPLRVEGEFYFLFVVDGTVALRVDADPIALGPADAVVIPPASTVAFGSPSADLELLEVTLPAHPPCESLIEVTT